MKVMIFFWARCYVLAAQIAQVVDNRVCSVKYGSFTPVLLQHLELCFTYPKIISAVKKGEDKKVQVTEWPKDVISLWGQEKSYTS